MITIAKKLTIMRKPKVSEFMTVNFKVLGDIGSRKIGGSDKAENAMLVNSEELATYLPMILGVSPTSPEWGKAVDNYVRSISVPIGDNGYDMEVGFIFDITDITRKEAILRYAIDAELIGKDERSVSAIDESKFAEHVAANVKRDFWWKYARPINPADYYLWRYCQNYRPVANSLKDVDDKSLHIRFYIVDEEEILDNQKKAFKIKNEANRLYISICDKPEKVRSIMFLLSKGDIVLTCKTPEDLIIALDAVKDANTAEFIFAAKSLEKRQGEVFIEECIAYNLLQRAAHSKMIIDPSDGTFIGSDIKEAAAFMAMPSNAKYANTLQGAMKSKVI